MQCFEIRLIVQKIYQRSYVMNLSALCNVIVKNACTKLLTTCNRHVRLSDCNKAVITLLCPVCCKLFTCSKLVVNLRQTVRRQLVDRIVTRCALLGVCCRSCHSSHNVTLSTFPVRGNWSTRRKPRTLGRALHTRTGLPL